MYHLRFENFYATVIQRAYRNYKKRPESLAKRIWEAVRNDGIPDRKKLLGITPRDTYPAPSWSTRDDEWIIEKKWQLSITLNILLELQNARNIRLIHGV
ncbi:hypothetical protein C1646_778438 [Rhizophagus diaphanus]|nr:hypothetical protein C1646_778438 [Rhizophagus diaphanus] [Rhizophagus sp. MUCL 43196]